MIRFIAVRGSQKVVKRSHDTVELPVLCIIVESSSPLKVKAVTRATIEAAVFVWNDSWMAGPLDPKSSETGHRFMYEIELGVHLEAMEFFIQSTVSIFLQISFWD